MPAKPDGAPPRPADSRNPPLTVRDLAATTAETTCDAWCARHPGPWMVELRFGQAAARGEYRTIEAGSGTPPPDALQLRAAARVWPVRKTIKLFPGRVMIGRAPNNDIEIPDANVSKLHAYLTLAGDSVKIADAGSSNGTYLGERRLGVGEIATLADHQLIRFGSTALVLYVTGAGLWPLLQR